MTPYRNLDPATEEASREIAKSLHEEHIVVGDEE